MLLFKRLRILPLLFIVACLVFTVRLGEFYAGLEQSGTAFAKSEKKEAGTDSPIDAHADSGGGGESHSSAGGVMGPVDQRNSGGDVNLPWQDATEEDFAYSDVQAELYEDLSERRRALDQREREMATRAALLEAAERELDQKFRELKSVQGRIESMLENQSNQQLARITSLVKIYEGMKAKEAARIFDTLDMEILIRVMSGMSERKLSPILAAMNPERARTVTILLAQKNQLPAIQ